MPVAQPVAAQAVEARDAMRRLRSLGSCLFVLCVAWSSLAVAEEPAAPETGDPGSFVPALMEAEGLPSLSVAVSRPGRPSFEMAAGLADVELGVPATSSTVYRVGSISKTITATAVMQLAESELMDLDSPVEEYCPAFPKKTPGPTPRQLLAHLGGIRHYNFRRFQEEFLSGVRYEALNDALEVFKADPLASEPGAEYLYSSFGYVLLGCAIEGASGVSFAEFLREGIFEPAGILGTRLDVPDQIVPDRARPYSKASDGTLRNSPFVDLSDRYPAGGLLSTPRDLVAFARALLEGRLIGAASWAAMREQQATETGESTGYGLGWRLSEESGVVFHGGTSVGGSAYLWIDVESGTAVALATNVDRWTEPRHDLARKLADWSEAQ